MNENPREEHARAVELEKFHQVLKKLRRCDIKDEFVERKFVQCSSGSREMNTSLATLIQSGNKIVDKCATIFVNLAMEVDVLVDEAHSKYFNALLLYGEDADGILFDEKNIDMKKDSRAGIIQMMTNFFPLLYDLSVFVGKCHIIVKNIFLQLNGFFNLSSSDFPNANDRSMVRIWCCLGDVLCILMTLDKIILAHPLLIEHWNVFFESLQIVQHNLGMFLNTDDSNITLKKLYPLLGIIAQIQQNVLCGNIFKNCCQQNYFEESNINEAFLEHFQNILFDILTQWERLARDDLPDLKRLSILICLTIFFYQINNFNSAASASNAVSFLDKKFFKALCMTNKRILSFYLVGDILWTPLEFLFQHISMEVVTRIVDKKTLNAIEQNKITLLDKHLEMLTNEVQSSQNAINEWKSELKVFASSNSKVGGENNFDYDSSIKKKCFCILKGARIAKKNSRLIKFVLNSCLAVDRVLSKSCIQLIFRLIEHIQSISMTLNFYWPLILDWTSCACALYSSTLLTILSTINSQFLLMKSQDPKILDTVSSIQISIKALCGTPTRFRMMVSAIALDLANYTKSLRPIEISQIDYQFIQLDTFLNVGLLLSRVTDFSFFYWHRSLAGIYFGSIVLEPHLSIENLLLFCGVLNQCCNSQLFNSVYHCAPESVRSFYQNEIFASFKEKLLKILYTAVETDLRLSSHQRQELKAESIENSLFQANGKVSSRSQENSLQLTNSKLSNALQLVQFLSISTNGESFVFRVGNRSINVKEFLSANLNANFYNLTTVALHDCETYIQMRALARTRYYFLDLGISSHLPYMAINQGLDIVMIMRNIEMFVENYSYDLNEQMFVERSNKSRVLNVVFVDQIVNSIKTHGFGILNSSVHQAYRYLKLKLQSFSQFLFDDQIKSLLTKEIRYYRDHIDELNQMYPLKRAENLQVLIRKIGSSADEKKSFLDKFRMSITQIGNTLAIIRMLCVGAVESCAYAAQFAQKFGVADQFHQITSILKNENVELFANLSNAIENEAKMLETLTQSVKDAFGNFEDFVEILITVFAKEFRNYEKFLHLRNFFIIIPTLSVNHVEHIFACRNRLGKRLAVSASADTDYTFVNDGFSFGISYVLKLLNQDFYFDSLNWFNAVRSTLIAESKKSSKDLISAQKKKIQDESLIQALAIKASRSEELLNDYEYLEHTLSTALIFFRVKENGLSSISYNIHSQNGEDDEVFLEDF